MQKDTFSSYHPVLNLYYFCFVLGINMFVMHPMYLVISLLGGTVYGARLRGVRSAAKSFFFFSLPVMIIVALMNPLFNHYGVTILFYLNNGNPITLESMIYGVTMAAMLCGVMANFRCVNDVMTSDKFIYLFGRIIPAMSLILSMVMRFIPEFRRRAKTISQGQKGIGRDVENGSVIQKIRHGITILSILVTWSLEHAIETADSMKSRGYGLPGRTSFSIYRFDRRDKKLLVVFILLSAAFFAGCFKGYALASYDPRIHIAGWPVTLPGVLMYLIYFCMCFMPVILDIAERLKWSRLQSSVQAQSEAHWRVYETTSWRN